jgi:hypothetical protein
VAERVFTVPALDGQPGPALRAAIAAAPDLIRDAWLAAGAPHNDQGGYLAALNEQGALQYPYLGNPLTFAVVNPTPQAAWIEEGRMGFHLPAHWGRGTGKWKIGKSGRRYAHVVFRHRTPVQAAGGSTPGRRRMAMPAQIASLASQLVDGARLSMAAVSEALETGRSVPRRMRPGAPLGGDLFKQGKSYDYYRELFPGSVPDYLPSGYDWASSPFEGLRHRIKPTPEGGFQSTYDTVRTITPDSEGFFIPPSPAYRVAARALDEAAPAIQRLLDAAAEADAAQAIVDATRGLFDE